MARLGSARPGPARLGSVRFGSARLGSIWSPRFARLLRGREATLPCDDFLPRSLGGMMLFLGGRGLRRGLFGKPAPFVRLGPACGCEGGGSQIHREESPHTGQGRENKHPRMTSVQINPGTRRGARTGGQETMKLTARQGEENSEQGSIPPQSFIRRRHSHQAFTVPTVQSVSTGAGAVHCVQRPSDTENSGPREVFSPLSSLPSSQIIS